VIVVGAIRETTVPDVQSLTITAARSRRSNRSIASLCSIRFSEFKNGDLRVLTILKTSKLGSTSLDQDGALVWFQVSKRRPFKILALSDSPVL